MLRLGFPTIKTADQDKRDFLPEWFANFVGSDLQIVLEEGYGHMLDYTHNDYLKYNSGIIFSERNEVFKSDIVVVLRPPANDDLDLLQRDTIFISMLHFTTHFSRNQLLSKRGIIAISMDSLLDSTGMRVIEDFEHGVENAFGLAMAKVYPEKEKLNITILGSGGVGKAAYKISKNIPQSFKRENLAVKIDVLNSIDTADKNKLNDILSVTDILVDAAGREDKTKAIIDNDQLCNLPDDAVIVDLAADNYDENLEPKQTKGIEGIPTGSLNKQVFGKEEDWLEYIPDFVDSECKRDVISCYSWPAINPERCMRQYQHQLLPYIYECINIKLERKGDMLLRKSILEASIQTFINQNI